MLLATTLPYAQQQAYLLWLEERGFVWPALKKTLAQATAPTTKPLLVIIDVVDEHPGLGSYAALTTQCQELLRKMLAAIKLDVAEVTIFPLDLDPHQHTTVDSAEPAWLAPLQACLQQSQPQAVLCLGQGATHVLLGDAQHYEDLRGHWQTSSFLGDLPLLATFHPRDLLRYPPYKRLAWQDLLLLQTRLNTPTAPAILSQDHATHA